MSNLGYSSSLEVKAGSLEVRRFPGIGFSSCAAPTFSCVQGILNRDTNWVSGTRRNGEVYQNGSEYEYEDVEAEVQSSYSSEVRGMRRVELIIGRVK